MSPYQRMVLGYAVSRNFITWRKAVQLARHLKRYEKTSLDDREHFAVPFRSFSWVTLFWAVLRGSVDFPYTFSLGAVLALLTYAAVCFQAALHLGGVAARVVR